MKLYGLLFNETPQNSGIPGEDMVENNAGGYGYRLDKWLFLDRFLTIGSEGSTYYVGENKLTLDNIKNVLLCLDEAGEMFVDRVVEFAVQHRAPKPGPGIFALAIAASKHPDPCIRNYALSKVPTVCQTATQLFQFLNEVKQMRGFGRGLRRALAEWYRNKAEDKQLAYQVLKYRSREGWTHKDAMFLCRSALGTNHKNLCAIYDYVRGWTTYKNGKFRYENKERKQIVRASSLPQLVRIYEEAKEADSVRQITSLIKEHGLVREMIPNQWLNQPKVWEALFQKMPAMAMLRNLGNMGKHGLLDPGTDIAREAVNRLSSSSWVERSRLHPIHFLIACGVYGNGHGYKGSNSWTVNQAVKSAIEDAFYLSFGNIVPSGKRICVALDVSLSMDSDAGETGLSCRGIAAAMAMATVRSEPHVDVMAFTDQYISLPISKNDSLWTVLKKTSALRFGRTDCSMPMVHAMKHRQKYDAFVIYTDNETWFGNIHPSQALRQYRERSGIKDAKLVVVGITSTSQTIADPNDKGMLDVSGFDGTVPKVISDFIKE